MDKGKGERKRPDFPSDDKRRAAAELFAHGIGYVKAAWILGLSENTVRDWARAYREGRFTSVLSQSQFRYDEATRQRVQELRAGGMSWRELSRVTGVSVASCRKWVEAANASSGYWPGKWALSRPLQPFDPCG